MGEAAAEGVEVDDIRRDQLLFGCVQTGLDAIDYGSIGLQDQGFGWGMPVEIAQQLTCACPRDELVVVEIGSLCLDARAILNRLCHIWGKVALHLVPTAGTYFDLGSMFGDLNAYRRDVKHPKTFPITKADSPNWRVAGKRLRTISIAGRW
jgi:hypothetical protein